MELPVYSDVKIADDFGIVDFVSTGPRGQIRKRIQIRPSHRPEIFTLALGDLKPGSDEIDDTSISDNGDRSKILTTVAFAIDIYTTRYPERWIYFRGNTKAKTRMYRMVIGRNLIVLSSRYHIYAEINDKLILFTKNMNVDGFLIKKKNDNFMGMKKASKKRNESIHFVTMTLTVSEELNKLKGRNLAPEKFAEANKHIMKLKLPKIED